MGSAVIDLVGQRFGRLEVLHRVETAFALPQAWWQCRCDCGQEARVRGTFLRRGVTRSCGCMRRESLAANGTHRDRPRAFE